MAILFSGKNIGIFVFLLGTVPVFGADLGDWLAGGDGSFTNNPDLLRGSYETGCYYPAICGGLLDDSYGKNIIPPSNNNKQSKITPPPIPPNVAQRPRAEPLSLLAGELPIEYYQLNTAPANAKLDWALNLRGAYVKDYNGERFETILTPSANFLYQTRAGQYNLSGQFDLVKASDSDFRLANANANFDAVIKNSKNSSISFGANAQISQQDPNDTGLASNIVSPPTILDFGAKGAFEKKFAKLTTRLRFGFNRSLYSTTGLADGTWQDNSARNNYSYIAGLRLSQEISPIISAYADFEARRNIFDIASTSGLAVTQNNWNFVARGGLQGKWGEFLQADISAGYGFTKFDSASLSEGSAIIADANIKYKTTKGLELSANFNSDISTPDPTMGASLRTAYSLGLSAKYQVNDWLIARASANGNWASYVGIADIERNYSANIGFDYLFNRHINLSGDYIYQISNSTNIGKQDSHRFEFGVSYRR